MVDPENGTWSIDCGSLKSLIQPTFGQTFGWDFTTEQNRVYIAVCSTSCRSTLKPSFSSWSFITVAVSDPGGVLSPTMVMSHTDPSHLPLLKPAFFMYDSASFVSPLGFEMKSSGCPVFGSFGVPYPPASSNPAIPGGMKCVATAPTSS